MMEVCRYQLVKTFEQKQWTCSLSKLSIFGGGWEKWWLVSRWVARIYVILHIVSLGRYDGTDWNNGKALFRALVYCTMFIIVLNVHEATVLWRFLLFLPPWLLIAIAGEQNAVYAMTLVIFFIALVTHPRVFRRMISWLSGTPYLDDRGPDMDPAILGSISKQKVSLTVGDFRALKQSGNSSIWFRRGSAQVTCGRVVFTVKSNQRARLDNA